MNNMNMRRVLKRPTLRMQSGTPQALVDTGVTPVAAPAAAPRPAPGTPGGENYGGANAQMYQRMSADLAKPQPGQDRQGTTGHAKRPFKRPNSPPTARGLGFSARNSSLRAIAVATIGSRYWNTFSQLFQALAETMP